MKKLLIWILCVTMIIGIPSVALADSSLAFPNVNISPGKVVRLAGYDRFETAIQIADQIAKDHQIDFSSGGQFDSVTLASGNNYPDALSAAPLAYQNSGPILLVDNTVSASQKTMGFVSQNVKKTGKVYLVGGTAVIPNEFVQELINMGFSSSNIIRFGGQTMDDTSLLIAKQLTNPKKEVTIVSDANYYDALTMAPAAVIDNSPILLVSPSGMTQAQIDFCNQQSMVFAIGDITKTIKNSYNNPKLIGFGGVDRYATNSLAASQYADYPAIFVATGENYPDALAGAILAGDYYGSPIILTQHDQLPDATAKVLSQLAYKNKQSRTVTKADGSTGVLPAINAPTIYVLGGTGAIQDNVVSQIQSILTGPGSSS